LHARPEEGERGDGDDGEDGVSRNTLGMRWRTITRVRENPRISAATMYSRSRSASVWPRASRA